MKHLIELPEYAKSYVKTLNTNENVVDVLRAKANEAYQFYASIPEEKWLYKYEEGKWTIKEILLHIIDSERILAYRALRFARTDNHELAGFDQDQYVTHSEANSRNWQELLEEFRLVRESNILLFKNFSQQMLEESGLANNYRFSVVGLGFMIAGHDTHHRHIIKERYL